VGLNDPGRLPTAREDRSRPQLSQNGRDTVRSTVTRDPEICPSGRILIIDDQDRILQFVARGLHSEGYEVDVSADPHAGLEAAQAGGYDLVILDLLMPSLPGITVLDRLIQRRPQQVVIVL
jgi:PleD family two-component response regulator